MLGIQHALPSDPYAVWCDAGRLHHTYTYADSRCTQLLPLFEHSTCCLPAMVGRSDTVLEKNRPDFFPDSVIETTNAVFSLKQGFQICFQK